jgi:hypothetical protein
MRGDCIGNIALERPTIFVKWSCYPTPSSGVQGTASSVDMIQTVIRGILH